MITEVSQQEFLIPTNYRLIGSKEIEQYFYRVIKGDKTYYFSSVFEKEHFLIAQINNDTFLCPEDRLFVFSKNGDIQIAMSLWESIESIRHTDNFIFLFSERGVVKMSQINYQLYSFELFSDIIVTIEKLNEGFKIQCLDERVFIIE